MEIRKESRKLILERKSKDREKQKKKKDMRTPTGVREGAHG